MTEIVKSLEDEINRLNEKNPFFKDLCFDVDIIKDRSEDDCAASLSRKCPNLYFWIDCFEEDKNKNKINRFCFAYQIPSFLPNTLLEKVIPKDWWLGSESHLNSSYYDKIIFEIDCSENEESDYFKKFYKGNKAGATDISNLKKDCNSYSDRYLVYYPRQKKGKVESLETFEYSFKNFNELWEKIMKIANENVAKALLLDKHNIILQGAPGTGKTYSTAALALSVIGKLPEKAAKDDEKSYHVKVMDAYKKNLIKMGREDSSTINGQIGFVTFHQSMDYEDFVEGIKPKIQYGNETNKESVVYTIEDGIFKRMCLSAASEDIKANIDVFLHTLEESKRKIYGIKEKNPFIVLSYNQKEIQVQPQSTQKANLDFDIFTKGIDRQISGKEIKNASEYAKIIQESKTKRKSSNSSSDYNTKYYFALHNEFFKYMANNYVLIIDEINRGNVSKIFGELITLLEADKRKLVGADIIDENKKRQHTIEVTLPYSKKSFSVPSNLYIIGTMNTTDRSVGSIDYAVRRRFAFVTLEANENLVPEGDARNLFNAVKNFLNKSKYDMDIEDLMVGHSYFMDSDNLQMKWQYEILPLLMEYHKDGIISKSPLKDELGNEIEDVKKNYTAFTSKWFKKGTKETKA